MLAAKYRFHGRRSLRLLFRQSKTVRGQALSIKYAVNSRRLSPRCAVVVGRKVSKSAPTRNRIRRRLYESLRRNLALLPAGIDLAIFVYDDSLATMPAEDLETTIQELLSRITL